MSLANELQLKAGEAIAQQNKEESKDDPNNNVDNNIKKVDIQTTISDVIGQKPWLEALQSANTDAQKLYKSATDAFNRW